MRKGLMAAVGTAAALAVVPAANAAESVAVITAPDQGTSVPLPDAGVVAGIHDAVATTCALSGLQKNPYEHGAPPAGARVCWIYPHTEGARQEIVGIDGVGGLWTSSSASGRAGINNHLLVKLGAGAR